MKGWLLVLALTACHTAATYTKPTESELRARLTPLQFEVTQHAATEPPFENAYWDNHDAGIYVDVVTGQPLFSSLDKFESGTGWPSFVRPIDEGAVIAEDDLSHGMVRTEVLSSKGRSHLGHVFDDGPAPTNLRYCINSASLRFIPIAKLEAEGYGAYANRFAHAGGPIPAATTNACALPKPGEKPGCHATLATAIVIGDADELARTPGVLQVHREREGSVRVTYDPQVYKPR